MDCTSARHRMVATQILPRNVTDSRIRAALARIPREIFVPESKRHLAYAEIRIETMSNRWLPLAGQMGLALQAARIGAGDIALIIGPGTGYAAAVIAFIAEAVVGLEEERDTARQTSNRLAEFGIDNAIVESGVLAEGLSEQGPYDVIWIDGGAIDAVPDCLFAQLAPNGRLVAVVRENRLLQSRVYEKKTSGVSVSVSGLDPYVTALLPGFARPAAFVF